jgi:hypothetical protein
VAELSEQHKEAIVVQLARFRKPAEVAVWFKAEFGIDLGEHAVQKIVKYDPSRPAFEAGEKWRPIFEAARQDYLENVKAVPVANQGWRLQTLQEGIDAARTAKNWKLVAELMEQAAKEVGGVLTNERNVNVSDARRARDMSSEDRAALLGSIISEALATKQAQEPTKH